MAESWPVPREEIVVDGMDDPVAHVYGAEPLRLMVNQDGILTYLGEWGPLSYSPGKLRDFLSSLSLPQGDGQAAEN